MPCRCVLQGLLQRGEQGGEIRDGMSEHQSGRNADKDYTGAPFNSVPDDVPKARSTVRRRRARPGRLGCSPLRRLSVSPQVRRHVRRIQAQQISWLERAAARTSNTVHAQYTTGRHDVLYKQDEAHHEDDPRSHLDHSRQVT